MLTSETFEQNPEERCKYYRSHGQGITGLELYFAYPKVVIEESVRIFRAEVVHLAPSTYIGHGSVIKGYTHNNGSTSIEIGEGCWIGENCYLHGAGGIKIGKRVGIGPGTYMLTSHHESMGHGFMLENPLRFRGITIGEGADIEAKVFICSGVHIGRGAIVRAGSVVTQDIGEFEIWQGNPARFHKKREDVKPIGKDENAV